MDLRQRPGLEKQANDLLAPADSMLVTSESESFAASLYLERIQKLRRWVKSIYSDAKQPLAVAKRTLDAQERALIDPIKQAEKQIMGRILEFTTAQADRELKRLADQCLNEALVSVTAPPPPAPTVAPGMQRRSTYSATVTDVQALVLAVAGQILLDMPGSTKVTQRWLTKVCRPSPQASLGLLTASAPALNALARALKHDLSVPGTTLSETTTLVAK
tara:strand:- start:204 stop:857 length:654 start_codon:yes stop_codon:yes gene_type:complete